MAVLLLNAKKGVAMERFAKASLVMVLLALFLLLLGGCGAGYSPTSDGQTTGTTSSAAAPKAVGGADLQRVLIGFKSAPGPSDQGLINSAAGKIKYTYHLIPAVAASLPAQAITALSHNPRIEYIEPDAVATAIGDTVPWGVSRVNADDVWTSGNTGAGVKVAVIDTGIGYNHPDLAANYKGGYDYVNDDNDPMDDEGHGTHVSGILAAADNNGNVVGVAPGASLYGVKVLDSRGSGYYSDIIAGIQWAVTNGMNIASMSLGGTVGSKSLQKACDAAYKAEVLLVAAAGNSGRANGKGDTVLYPAKYASVIAVAASDSSNLRASWSSTGSAVELTAPGVGIPSDRLGGGTISYSGTSMACPHVSGCAALVIASGVTTAADIRSRLDSTATDLGATGRDTWYGYGLVNAQNAVTPLALASR